MDDDFYEDDEPIEDVRAAWKAGEKGTTSGPRDLNQRAKSIVDRAIQRQAIGVRMHVVSSGSIAATIPAESPDAGEDHVSTRAVEYLVG